MSSNGKSAQAIIETWRERGADRLDPVRFRFIEALASRADDHGGAARRILDERLHTLLQAYADDLAGKPSQDGDGERTPPRRESARAALGELLEHIGNHPGRAGQGAVIALKDAAIGEEPGAADPRRFPSAELPALLESRRIWAKVRAESQLRQSLERSPTEAGPLNSGALVHRSLVLMRELSPGYLQHLLAYVDALSWIEQMHDGGALAADTRRLAAGDKPARSRPRKRRN
jgi:hypothetical protein